MDTDGPQKAGLSRRSLIKRGAVAGGVGALVWTAPNIETLGFAPAGAQLFGTSIVILSPESDDKNSNSSPTAFCSAAYEDTNPCCDQSWGNSGQFETFTFVNPIPGCASIVVQTRPLDCLQADNAQINPDLGQTTIKIVSSSGANCGLCVVKEGVLLDSSQRTVLEVLDNGDTPCGVDISVECDNPNLAADARLAVRIECVG